MAELAERVYDFMRNHKGVCAASLIGITAVMCILVARLGYKEDITDFLPLDQQYHDALRVYEEISGGDRVIAIVQCRDTTNNDPDAIIEAIDEFSDLVNRKDTTALVSEITSEVDADRINDITDYVYSNVPYFLCGTDYERTDSLLSDEQYIFDKVREDKEQILMPSGEIAAMIISRDPLGLFSPVMQRMQKSDSGLKYEMYDGYIFSPDMSRGIVTLSSSSGAMESERNAELSQLTQECADSVMYNHANIEIHLTGGPIIAAGNANQIKKDSVISVAISVTLIVILLLTVFGGFRAMGLIGISIAWGWLFAVGGIACIHDSVSIIVLGISSVIIGIAVNYPLHYLTHLQHTPDRRKALREISTPLVVGNITTVGAFLTLVPLHSTALRDLGLFASLMLIGTILFVLVFLPHAAQSLAKARTTFIDRISDATPESRPIVVYVIVALTILFGIFSLDTEFDSEMGNINYMTKQQESDIEYFESQMSQTGPERKIYALVSASTPETALEANEKLRPALEKLKKSQLAEQIGYCGGFICSQSEQKERLARWQEFKNKHSERIVRDLKKAIAETGFSEDAFTPFTRLLTNEFKPQDIAHFAPLTSSIFSSNLSADSIGGRYSVVSILDVDEANYEAVKEELTASGAYAFDVKSMNSAIAERLSDDFNYIGFACGLIVYLFLWVSFGSIELALLSFVPMAVSWVWILGIMSIFGIKFNIVNIILATFIFGQGDDYTIFMTEGASYEYTYRRKMLSSYKSSIIVSALIMFIGIGTLIVAKHPALRSLAEVTIAGMTSVVLMAYVLPPLIFKYLVASKGEYRYRPIALLPYMAGLCNKITHRLPGVTIEDDIRQHDKLSHCVMTCATSNVRIAELLEAWGKCIIIGRKNEEKPTLGEKPIYIPMESAVEMARRLGWAIRPLSVFGLDEILPDGNPCIYRGSISIAVGEAVSADNISAETLKEICEAENKKLFKASPRAEHYREFVKDRFRYKDGNIYATVSKSLAKGTTTKRASAGGEEIEIKSDSYGEIALLMALTHPQTLVRVIMSKEENAEVLRHSAKGIAPNLTIVSAHNQADNR